MERGGTGDASVRYQHERVRRQLPLHQPRPHLDDVLDDVGQELGQVGRGELEAGVHVDLDQVHVQRHVQHEVVAQQLEAVPDSKRSNGRRFSMTDVAVTRIGANNGRCRPLLDRALRHRHSGTCRDRHGGGKRGGLAGAVAAVCLSVCLYLRLLGLSSSAVAAILLYTRSCLLGDDSSHT